MRRIIRNSLADYDLSTGPGRWKARHDGYNVPFQKSVSSPWFSCRWCAKAFQSSPSLQRKYCSYACHLASGGAIRAGLAASRMRAQYGAKKDANHRELVSALEAGGCQVIDISSRGYGAPDLIVCRRGETLLVELKNPKTGYGRSRNKKQVAWATNWPAPVYILKSLKDVTEFLNCRPVAVMVKK